MFDGLVAQLGLRQLGLSPRLTAELAILDGLEADPGPQRIAELSAVVDDALPLLGSADRVDLLRAIARQRSWLDALEAKVLVAVSERSERDAQLAAGLIDPDHDDPADAEVLGDAMLALDLETRIDVLRDSGLVDLHGQRTDWVREEIAAALRLAPVTAGQRLDLARDLVTKLPATMQALASGTISLSHARHVSDALAGFAEPRDHADPEDVAVEREVLGQSETWLLRGAERMTPGELKRRLVADVERLAPQVVARRAQRRRRERDVCIYAVGDGMAVVHATLPAEDAIAVMDAVDALAARPAGPADGRLVNERRADAFVGAFTGGVPACVDLLITTRLSTDLGALTGTDGFATIEGAGTPLPVPAEIVRDAARLLADGRTAHHTDDKTVRDAISSAVEQLRSLACRPGMTAADPGGAFHGPVRARIGVVDDRGALVALTPALVGAGDSLRIGGGELQTMDRTVDGYTAPPLMAEHVRRRWSTCAFPGCGRKASRCDNDHCTPHAAGGPTAAMNMLPLCRRHHRCKQAPGWSLELVERGRVAVWSTPTGHTYPVHPWDHGPPD